MKNAEQQQNQRRFQCQQKGWYLTGWHKPEHWAQVLTSAVTLTSCQDPDTEWLQLELLHHRPVPLYFWTYFPIPQFLMIFDTEREVSECGVRTDKFTEIRTSGGHHPEQKTKTWWIQGQGQSDVSKWWVFKTQKVTKIFSKIWARGRLLLYLSHKEKFRWNQTKTRYRGGRHVPGHIWSPGGLKRTAAENLFPFVRFTSEFMGF